MKKSKIIFGGVVILLLIAGVIFYYQATDDVNNNNNTDSTESNRSNRDSAAHSSHDMATSKAGEKPETNSKDGSVKIVKEFVKSTVKNPASFEFFEWSEISLEDGYWKVRCKYRGMSSFNAEVTTTAWFYIKNNKVVHTKIISKI
jgi:hypothetical protein